jgi:PAS domain S-box-containing protein
MTRTWPSIKSIIGDMPLPKGVFLSLLDEEGNIVCANSNMLKSLQLKRPEEQLTNFLSLVHPNHIDAFKASIESSRSANKSSTSELYLKNGHYHPMKWQVSHLPSLPNSAARYLCVGYKLLDDERFKKFNTLCNENYELIIGSMNVGIIFYDRKGEIIAANKKTAEIFKTSLETLYQLQDIRNLWNNHWHITTEAYEKISFDESPFMKAFRSKQKESQLLIIKLSGGEERFVIYNSQPLFKNGEAEPYAVVTNINDITRERFFLQRAEEKEIMLRSFMNRTPNLAWIIDEDACLLFASQSFCKYFNITESDFNKSIFDLVPVSVSNALKEKHFSVLENGIAQESTEKIKWADGSNVVFHLNIFPIEGVNGRKKIGGHAVNLSDQFAIEKKLQQANDRLLLLSRATTDAIWEWDMQSGYIFRNDALMDMIGYHNEQSRGLSWWLRRIHPEDRNRVTDKIKDATDKGQHSWEDAYRFKCSDGGYKFIQDRGYVVYENELPVKMIGSLQDITVLKDLEDQLNNEKLERQKEISETVIRVQEKERTRIGHELHDNVNQILSTTKLFVDMLKPSTREEKDIKKKSVEYLLMAIEEIRKLSKELVVPQLKDKGLVDSIKTLVDDIHVSHTIKIRFTHDHENDLLSPGKKVTLFRIVQEQLKNILKHSKAKRVEIFLQCKDNNAGLIIKDDGIGFDLKKTHRGIGLSNIHERIRFYNGTVEILTQPGQGCLLKVTIPTL